MSGEELIRYYADRAPEYETIYRKPERQADLALLKKIIQPSFINRHVLEIACGTGHWTEMLAEVASSVIATDINKEVLQIARAKPGNAGVSFIRADAYDLSSVPPCNACLSAFWWSHIPKKRVAAFLENLHLHLKPGATVMFVDNRYVLGSSTPISRRDDDGNSYQTRMLENGSTHEVLKNFPTEEELRWDLAPFCANPEIQNLEYYWVAKYTIP